MKKSLLLAAMALTTLGLSAQNLEEGSQLFSAEFNGETIENGAHIYSTAFEDYGSFGQYAADVKMINKAGEEMDITATMEAVSPDYATISGDFSKYGMPQLCIAGQSCFGGQGEYFALATDVKLTPAGFEWQIHQTMCQKDGGATFRIRVYKVVEDDITTDPQFYFDVTFGENTAVDAVEIDGNQPVEYFDLQGRKVLNPAKGLYILRQGDKTVKKIIR